MVEQGTERIMDFIKQRRRWYVGLLKVVIHAPVKLRLRLPLAFFTALWSVSWGAILYTYVNLIVGWDTAPVVQLLGNLALATYVVIYVVGLRTTLALYKVPFARKVRLYVAQVACIPLFSILETAGVLFAIVKPETGFHVVQKRCCRPKRADGSTTAGVGHSRGEGAARRLGARDLSLIHI